MEQNINITRGDTCSFNIQFVDFAGDLEHDVQDMFLSVKEDINSPTIFQKSLGNGISKVIDNVYVVRIAPEDTEDMALGYYYYDFEVKINDDVFTLLKGVMQITYDVTEPTSVVTIAPYAELQDIRVGYDGIVYPSAGDAVRDQVNDLHEEVDVLDGRMDEFASLPEGSTAGNAELVDIRVGANGITYPSAGDAVRGQVEELDDKILANATDIGEIDSDVDVLKARMDIFASLPDGSTVGDAELEDIRVGADGVTYASAGDAVRGQVSDLKTNLDALTDGEKITSVRITSNDLQQGYWLNGVCISSETKRICSLHSIKVKQGFRIDYSFTGTWQVAFFLYQNEVGTSQTAIDSTSWLTGTGHYDAPSDGYLVFNIGRGYDVITPSDFIGTITYDLVNNTQFMDSIISNTQDIKALWNPNADVTYKKGLPYANGTIVTTSNGVVSNVIRLLGTLYISSGTTARLLLYDGTTYVGKVNSSGGVDQVGGDWKDFIGLVDVAKLLKDNHCDGVLIALIPDSATISNDTEATSFAEAHLEYSTTSCIIEYIYEQDSIHDIPQTFAFNMCAHRGNSVVKENTIEAFDRAIYLGYRVIETDINWTSDNECILYHDSTINGTNVYELTYAQIHAIDPDIPTYTEMLLWAKKHKCLMLLDCVGRVTNQRIVLLYNTTAQYGMLDNVVFSVVEDYAYYMVDNSLIKTNVSVNFYGKNPTVEMIQGIDPKVNQFKSVMTGYNKDDITSEIILASHLKGYPVEIATTTTKEMSKSYYEMGVDILVCDADELWEM